jgi:hypothetical protein
LKTECFSNAGLDEGKSPRLAGDSQARREWRKKRLPSMSGDGRGPAGISIFDFRIWNLESN